MMKLGTVISYLKKTQKNIKIMWHTPLILFTSTFFHRKSATLVISRNTDTDCILIHNFYFFKVLLINMVAILMISANLVSLSFLKIKEFWNNVYDVILYVHHTAIKFLSSDSNYIVNVVMWPKSGNSSISMREVIITLIL